MFHLICHRLYAYLRVSSGLQLTLNFPPGSLPNLGVSHHPEVNGYSGTSKHPLQDWCPLILVPPHSLVPILHLGAVNHSATAAHIKFQCRTIVCYLFQV